MQMLRRSLMYFASALALCFTSMGFATESPTLRYAYSVAADQGGYGAESAKCRAELAYMAQPSSVETGVGAGLTVESNGFRMTSLTSREVTGGMTGSTGMANTVV